MSDLLESTTKSILANKKKNLERTQKYWLATKPQKIKSSRFQEFEKVHLQKFQKQELQQLHFPD